MACYQVALVVGLACGLAAAPARADVYPSRPVHVIVPFPPGGSTDQVARPFADRLSQAFGQPFVIDNKGGAAGSIGTEAVARAPKDGYTLLMTPMGPLVIVPNLRKTPYDPVSDLVGVGRLANGISGMAVHPSVPASTIQEFLAYVRANPGKVFFGSGGQGTVQHLRGEVLNKQGGLEMVHVPYRNSGEALSALLAGEIQMQMESVVIPYVRAGKLKLLAFMEPDGKLADYPDVPTIQASGFPNFDLTSWFATFAPAGTPREIVDRLNAEMVKIARSKEIREQLLALAFNMAFDTPEQLDATVKRDIGNVRKWVQETGITIQ